MELDPNLYTVAWIAPLEIEARAALHLLDNCHRGQFPWSPGYNYLFHAGDINGHNVIIATFPSGSVYGTGAAAALSGQIITKFPNLRFGLLVGVAAGLPNFSRIPPLDIRLGDVLVGLSEGESAGIFAHGLGKETKDGFEPLRHGHALATTGMIVMSAISQIKIQSPNETKMFLPFYESIKGKEHAHGTFLDPGQDQDNLYEVDQDGIVRLVKRERRPDSKRVRVWYGLIASGDKLMKNTEKRNELRDKYNVIGLEMEAAGTMNQIPVGVIRGVCDYGDEHKNKGWQPYAAAMAAAYAKAVLYQILPKSGTTQRISSQPDSGMFIRSESS
jgi:nucleoside phosphorylase